MRAFRFRKFSVTTLESEIEKYATFNQTPLSVKQLVEFGKRRSPETTLQSAAFLRDELPIRLAHMVKEFESIPKKFFTDSSREVAEWYRQSFGELIAFESAASMRESTNVENTVTKFTSLVKNIMERHANVVTTVAAGIAQLKEREGSRIQYSSDLHLFLDRFYMSRIGIRNLQTQHIELVEGNVHDDKDSRFVGLIDQSCEPAQIAHQAAENAQFLCMQTYAESPNFEVRTFSLKSGKGGKVEFPYIPAHLYHVLFELIKNSMRATIEQDHEKATPIKIVIVEGKEDLTIKISDEGGGIPRSAIPFIFTYLYTTAKTPLVGGGGATGMNDAPLAGFGYGLPLSRLYARYLGGDLNIVSTEGFGTDAFIYLRRLSSEANEALPVYTAKRRQ